MKKIGGPCRHPFHCTKISFLLLLLASFMPGVNLYANDPKARQEAGKEIELRDFIVEKTPVLSGAELITVFGKFSTGGSDALVEDKIPLVSVLRDTLGDAIAENDRLRYVWMFTYTRPDVKKKVASAVPFLYASIGRKDSASSPPPPLLDLAAARQEAWHKTFRSLLFKFLIDSRDWYIQAPARSFRHNTKEYRLAHRLRALAVLSLLDGEPGSASVLSAAESREIQSHLMLAEQSLGGFIDDRYLERVYQKRINKMRVHRARNWELLRQRAEAEGLYFEPIEMPDGSATHVLLWIAKADLAQAQKRPFQGRFLSIANPWEDKRLQNWQGYSQIRHPDTGHRLIPTLEKNGTIEPSTEETSFDSDNPTDNGMEMIPLAVYGLDHPKIPILLVDFRDGYNAKLREASRRAIQEIAYQIFYASRFGDFRYMLARAAFNFFTSRRGADINQPSRLRAYTQLKLLLSISDSLDPDLKKAVSDRLERVSLNPLENDLRAELELSVAQYQALMEYASRPDGLAAQVNRDRGEELSNLLNSKWKKTFFGVGNLLTFGIYEHREPVTAATMARLGTEREIAYHRALLQEAVNAGQPIEVAWDIETVRRSLRFITENSATADAQTISLAEQIFSQTDDEETRELSLLCFYRINKESAKAALLRIYKNDSVEQKWRTESAIYLRKALNEQQRIDPAVAKEIAGAGL